MTAWDRLPAHLVPAGELHGDFGRLTFGTPASPERRVSPPPIVTIRPAGPHASELYVRTGDGAQLVVVPLSYGLLINLLEDATAALRRCEETR